MEVMSGGVPWVCRDGELFMQDENGEKLLSSWMVCRAQDYMQVLGWMGGVVRGGCYRVRLRLNRSGRCGMTKDHGVQGWWQGKVHGWRGDGFVYRRIDKAMRIAMREEELGI